MPNRSKEKGNRTERQVVKLAQEWGHRAERIPLSGSTWMKGDVRIWPSYDEGKSYITGEIKARKNAFKFLYDNLEGFDFLAVKADGKRILIVQDIEDFLANLQ